MAQDYDPFPANGDHGTSHIQNSIIELNVGGTIFTTTTETLLMDGKKRSVPGSKLTLAALRDGEVLRDSEGRPFFDRDPRWFHYILNYKRNGYCPLPESSSAKQELLYEAEFYNIPDMIRNIRGMRDYGAWDGTTGGTYFRQLVLKKTIERMGMQAIVVDVLAWLREFACSRVDYASGYLYINAYMYWLAAQPGQAASSIQFRLNGTNNDDVMEVRYILGVNPQYQQFDRLWEVAQSPSYLDAFKFLGTEVGLELDLSHPQTEFPAADAYDTVDEMYRVKCLLLTIGVPPTPNEHTLQEAYIQQYLHSHPSNSAGGQR